MRDRPVIYLGLAAFLVVATFPVWSNIASGTTTKGPVLPQPRAKQCVAPTAYMKASHMDLLSEWRDEVVRSDSRDFVAFDGKVYKRSLSSTCLEQCHVSRTEFCDRCHTYAAVSVTCWDCHVDTKQVLRAARRSR